MRGNLTWVFDYLDRFMEPYWPSMTLLFVIGWFLSFALGRPAIGILKRLKGMRWSPREDTPDSHLAKAGIPSMGGLFLVGGALAGYLAFNTFVLTLVYLPELPAGTTVGVDILQYTLQTTWFALCIGLHALLGFVDDWSKARGRGGITSRQKLAGQIVISGAFVLVAYLMKRPWQSSIAMSSGHPWLFAQTLFDGHHDVPPLLLFYILGLFTALIVATSNAVNLTDGIDGLAAGLAVQCGLAFVWIGKIPWETTTEDHYEVPWMWAALAGACLGFLAYNRHPAKIFMGDTGSLALGAALGAGALLTGSLFLLPFLGFIFFAETLSVIVQVAHFKYTKRKFGEGHRLFRRAPLHHHYELSGWSEWRVVATFWALNAVTTAIGLYLWDAGYLPHFP